MTHIPEAEKEWKAFDKRIRSATLARRKLPLKPLSGEEKDDRLRDLFSTATNFSDRVIYVNIPFCNKLCSFCIYNKMLLDNDKIPERYFRVLNRHITSRAETEWARSLPFRAVYFGGGTPTAVATHYIVSTLELIKKHYPLSEDCEITVESTITDIDNESLSDLKKAGVNRISLGVQTFCNPLRNSIGRNSDREDIIRTIELIKRNGITDICIDLMYNFEGQDIESWHSDIEQATRLPITSCSVYPLITMANSSPQLLKETDQELEKEYDFFILADRSLPLKKGWKRITPVQYGHATDGRSVYVSSHGQSADIMAFGAGAAGRRDNLTYLQTSDVNKFIDNSSAGITLLETDERFLLLRKIYLLSEGLRITDDEYNPIKKYFEGIISGYRSKGLIRSSGNTLELTRSGRFWAGNLSAVFSERISEVISDSII